MGLGTTPIDPRDNKSHAVIHRYQLQQQRAGPLPRQRVAEFFMIKRLSVDDPEKCMRRDLFLLAFAAVQALDSNDRWSFYQIAGIHGLPMQPYDGDNGFWDPFNPDWWGGYCQHGSPLFPTWHRPYVMLLEQSIIRQAQLIGSTLSDREEGVTVLMMAPRLRFPYWDWARQGNEKVGVPDIFTTPEIHLFYPWKSFGFKKMANPLKAFVVPESVGKPIASSVDFNPAAKPSYQPPSHVPPYLPQGYPTVRYPDSAYSSQEALMKANMMLRAGELRQGVRSMFQQCEWLPFSNHSWREGEETGPNHSIEHVHDTVHDTVGGAGGQMSWPEDAAFDPIFFFHHCNVDRLLALWQYCHPKSWIPNDEWQLDHEGTFTNPPDSTAFESTDLTPFRRSDSDHPPQFITSDDIRLVEADCNYTYPEIIRAREGNWTPAHMLNYLLKHLYPSPSPDYAYHWVLVVERIQKRAFNGPFSIRVFLLLPDADATTPLSSPNFAGDILVFARSSALRCTNCDVHTLMRASLDLTNTMLRLGITTTEDLARAPASTSVLPNPLAEDGSVRLVFVDLNGRQLDVGTVQPKASLYCQEDVKDVPDGVEDVEAFLESKFVQAFHALPFSFPAPFSHDLSAHAEV